MRVSCFFSIHTWYHFFVFKFNIIEFSFVWYEYVTTVFNLTLDNFEQLYARWEKYSWFVTYKAGKGYLHYKTITSKNVSSKTKVNNFLIS